MNIIENISKKALIYIITIGAVLMGFSEEGFARSSSSYKKTSKQAPYYLSNKSHKHNSYRSFFSFIFPLRYSQPKVKFIKPWKKTTISTKSDQVFLLKFTGRNLDYDTFVFSVNGEDRSSELARFWTFSGGKLKFGDGKYIVKAKIADKLGRYSKTEKRKLLIDSTAPEIIFAEGPEDQFLQDSVYKLDVTLKDALVGLKNNSIRVFLNGKDITRKLRKSRSLARVSKLERRIVADLEIDSSRENFVLIKASDKLGNTVEVSKKLVVELNQLSLSNLVPVQGQSIINSTGQVLISGDSNLPLSFISVNGVSGTITAGGLKFEVLLPLSASGTQSVDINAQTASGQSKSISYAFDVLFDNTAPVVSADISSGVITSSKAFSFNLSVEDENSTATKVMLNGVEILQSAEKNILVETELAEGLNKFEITSTDVAGNVSEVLKIEDIDLDIVPIILSNQMPQESSVVLSSTGRIQVSGVSSRKLKSLKVNGVEMSVSLDGLSYQGEVSFSTGGIKELNILSENEKGLTSESSYSFELNFDNIVPIVALQGTQNTTTDNKAYSFSVSIIDSNDTTTEVFQNGTLIEIRSEKSFVVTSELTEGSNTFSVVSRDILNNTSETQSLSGIVLDTVPIVLTFDSPQDSEELVTNSTTATVTGSSNRVLRSLVINGTQAAVLNNGLVYSGQIEVTESGVKTITLIAENEFGKKTSFSYNVNVVFDNIAPELLVTANENFSTNQSAYSFQIKVEDNSEVETRILQNGNLIKTTTNRDETIQVVLEHGSNSFEVISEDRAGNLSESKIISGVTLDTVMPFITWDTPQNGEEISDLDIYINGSSNEQIQTAKINGEPLFLSLDGLTFSGKITPSTIGDKTLFLEVNDIAGNTFEATRSIKVLNKIINIELVNVGQIESFEGLIVEGMKMATRPGTYINISTPSGEYTATSDFEGKFEIRTEYFEAATLKAEKDGEVVNDVLTFNIQTKFAGVLLDPMDNPLSGATVTILSDGPDSFVTRTNAQGVFSFEDPPVGDQSVVIDGSTVDLAVGSTNKFSAKTIKVNISYARDNTIRTPIYFAPIILDGTETNILNGSSAQVTSPNAPGLVLNIPQNSVTFPDGTNTGAISIAIAPSDRTTVAPPDFAVPQNVYCLEPSGTKFSENVQVTLPNVNELPEGVELVVLSMDSTKGTWDIDGYAKVDSGGGTITTMPGKGITHFSEIYVVPLMPVLESLASSKEVGINVADGALKTNVTLPSYKVLGRDFSVGLNYDSSTAKPTAYISNYFDIPEQRIVEDNGRVDIEKCAAFCEGQKNLPLVVTDRLINYAETWYQPESVSFEFFVNGVQTEEPTTFEGERTSKTIYGQTIEYNDIPRAAQVSYAVEMKEPATDTTPERYFDSGFYTALSRYTIKLKQLFLRNYERKVFTNRGQVKFEFVSRDAGELFEEIFETNLKQNVIVDNQTKSSLGRGWRLNGLKRLLNPDQPRVILDNGAGSYVVYAKENLIDTVLDADQENIDLTKGIGFSGSEIIATGKDGSKSQVELLDYSGNLLGGSGFELPNYAGTIRTENPRCAGTCFANGGCNGTSTTQVNYSFNFKAQTTKFIKLPSGDILSIGKDDSSVFLKTRFGSSAIDLNVRTFSNRINKQTAESICDSRDGTCGSPVSTAKTCPIEVFWQSNGEPVIYDRPASSYPGFNPDRSGGSTVYANSPEDILVGPDGFVYMADTGNNRVVKFSAVGFLGSTDLNKLSNRIIPVAGNKVAQDSGNGGSALSASIKHPKGLAFDDEGNLYISSEAGFIRKVNSEGNISRVAGLPLSLGGLVQDSGEALQTYINNPQGLVVDNDSNTLFVSDTGNHRILAVDLSTGQASTFAGTGDCDLENIGDKGAALNASFCSPTYLHLDSDKNLFIVDSGHNRIRKVNIVGVENILTYSPQTKDNSLLTKNSDGSWMRELRNGTVENYNSQGLLLNETDLIGKSVVYDYNGADQIISITDPVGEQTGFTYSGAVLDSITDPYGRESTFSYNDGKLERVTFPDGSKREYRYSADGLLLEQDNERGLTTSYDYNSYGRVTKITQPDGSFSQVSDAIAETLANDAEEPILKQYNPTSSETETVVEDANGRISTRFNYDTDGFIITSEDALGRKTHTIRNNEGRPVEIYRPDGTLLEIEYDQVTQDVLRTTLRAKSAPSVIDSEYDVTVSNELLTYDNLGNVILRNSSFGFSTSKTVDPSTGLINSETDAEGRLAQYQYNALGLLTSMTRPIDGSNNFVLSNEYDSSGRLIRTTTSSGEEKLIFYDSYGNLVEERVKKEEGIYDIRKFSYDLLNRLTQVEEQNGDTTQYTYTSTGSLNTIIDPKGQSTVFSYDLRDRLIKKQYPNSQTWDYSYDDVGNMIYTKDPRGSITQLEYDSVNRVSRKVLSDDIYNYEYDLKDNITRAENNGSLVIFDVDFKGNLIRETVSGKGNLANYPLHSKFYTYNIEELKSSYSDSVVAGATTYQYKNNGQLSQLSDPSFGQADYIYDDLDRLREVQGPHISSSYDYGLKSFLTAISHKKGSVEKSYFNLDRGESGLVRRIASTIGEENFSYDDRNQLLNADHPSGTHDKALDFSNEVFTYDNLGNRTSSNFGSLTYDQYGYALEEDFKFRYTYDLNGNMITKEDKLNGQTVKYDYTSENRLKKVSFLNSMTSSTPEKVVEYLYDAIGRRVQKSVTTASTSDLKKYTYDGQEIVNQLGPSNELLARYAHSGLRTDDVLGVSYTPAAVSRGIAKIAGSFSYLKDHLGSVKQIADSNGNVIQTNNYSAFGVLTSVQDSFGLDITSSPEVEVYHSFTGREWDKDAELYYYRARFYDASTGRFIQQDPHPGTQQLPLSLNNKYTYAYNNPNSYVDPDGKFGILLGIFLSSLYTAGISAIQSVIQTELYGGKFSDYFGRNFAINFGATLSGITAGAAQGARDFNIGWGGINSRDSDKYYGWSFGYYQFIPGTSEPFKGHEIGHSANFFVAGLLNNYQDGVPWGTLGYFGLTLPGTGPLQNKYNPFSWIGEGSADVWGRIITGEWYALPIN